MGAVGGPGFLKDGDERENKSAYAADHGQTERGFLRAGVHENVPGPGGGGNHAEEQHACLVDSAL